MENPNSNTSFFKRPAFQSITGVILILIALVSFIYWKSTSSYVAIDMSQISAPMIALGPETSGILEEIYVRPGDLVSPEQSLARVGAETLSAKVAGVIISVNNTPGQVFNAGAAVVTMIDPEELRVVGKIDEDKGFSDIQVGEPALFTVDAFGNEEFSGIVDEVSPTSNQSSIIFSISDRREVKQFDIKVRFDPSLYSKFKNGMSAKLRVYVK